MFIQFLSMKTDFLTSKISFQSFYVDLKVHSYIQKYIYNVACVVGTDNRDQCFVFMLPCCIDILGVPVSHYKFDNQSSII